MDELHASDISGFLQGLVALSNQKPHQIKALVSSRPLPQIQKVLGGIYTVKTVRLENRLVNRDISRFVEYRLDQDTYVTDKVRDEIKRSIEDRVYPSFLYARLMLNELLEGLKRPILHSMCIDSHQRTSWRRIPLRNPPCRHNRLPSVLLEGL